MSQAKFREENSNDSRCHIAVRLMDRIKLIQVEDIYYFKAESKYVAVHTKQDKYLINTTLNQLEDELRHDFIRVHRNCLVAIRYLDGIEKIGDKTWCILFKGIDDKLKISRRQKPIISGWLRGKG